MAEDILPGFGLDLRQKQVHNKWTEHQRVVLCCLFRFYKLENAACKDIFNFLFAAELRSCGFGNAGIKYGSLHTQWVDMRNKGHQVWRKVHIETRERVENWTNVLMSIEQAAKSLGVELVRKHVDDSNISKFRPKKPKKPHALASATVPTPVSLQFAPDPQNTADEETTSSSPSSETGENSIICAKGCLWCFWEGKNPLLSEHSTRTGQNDQAPSSESDYVCRDPPPLLYRWYNDDSQGVNSAGGISAGLFATMDEDQVPVPGDCSVATFKEHFMNHIQRKRISTPLISTFECLLAPIHRAIRAGKNAFVSIIDPTKLNVGIYCAKSFVRKERVRIPHYRGYGEYLVWGRISTESIICTFSVDDLLGICERHADVHQMLQPDIITSHQSCRRSLKMQLAQGSGRIDRFSGMTIGKLLFLLGVPFDYTGNVGARIAHNWQFSKAITSEEIDDFGQGIQTGYSLLSGSEVTTAPPPLASETVNALHVPLLWSVESDVFVDTSDSDSDSDTERDKTRCPAFNSRRVVELFHTRDRVWVPAGHGQTENPGSDLDVRAEGRLVMPRSLPTTVTEVTEVSCGVADNPIIVGDDVWVNDEINFTTHDVHNPHDSLVNEDDDMMMTHIETLCGEDLSSETADRSRALLRIHLTESFEEERARIRRVLETGS